MCAQMNSPGDKQPPKEWWFENACRIAAFRLRNKKHMGVNVMPLREQIRGCVEFVRVVWEEIERHIGEDDHRHDEIEPRQSALSRLALPTLLSCHRHAELPPVIR